ALSVPALVLGGMSGALLFAHQIFWPALVTPIFQNLGILAALLLPQWTSDSRLQLAIGSTVGITIAAGIPLLRCIRLATSLNVKLRLLGLAGPLDSNHLLFAGSLASATILGQLP